MATRDEVFHRFGPFQIEGILIMLMEEINRLRVHMGLQPRTFQQVLNELNNHQTHLEPYDWMPKRS